LAHCFRGYSPWSVGSIVLGPELRQNLMIGVCGRTELLTSWQLGNKEMERNRPEFSIPFKGTPPVTSLPFTRPAS
jgi:hypothetical protein